MIKVIVTDDHELYLEGLCLLLNKQEGIEVVGQCSTGNELIQKLSQTIPDILLLDLNLPDTEDEILLQTLRKQFPALKIIYLTMMRGTRYLHKLQKYGIQGYLLKTAGVNELRLAIETVASGQEFYSKDVNIQDNQNDFRSTITVGDRQLNQILSKRELEVLKYICLEYSNSDIAAKLFLSVSTVETHRKNLIGKLGVNNTVGLVKFALKNGIID